MKIPIDLHEAWELAILGCKNQFAMVYLKHVLRFYREDKLEHFNTNLTYALSNMQYWRGEQARHAKRIFRKYLKETEDVCRKKI